MKRLSSLLVLLATLLSPWASTNAQLIVTGGYTAQQLAENLAGPGFTVTNATLTGSPLSRGLFTATGTNLGVSSGVILATGLITDAPGSALNGPSTDFFQPGDPALTTIAASQTFDAAVLQFDFLVESDNIQFNFVFASDEYPEFVGSINDVFAFFISGPGITGQQNIALVPGTTTPVTINNINAGSYWQYFVDNQNGTHIAYDAFTTRLTARRTGLIPCETYTLSLRIADAADGILDSGVFLEENSLVQGTVSAVTNTVSGDSIALEGCIRASFTFNLDSTYSTAQSIPITVGGTATNGVDYAYIDSLIIIPAGQQSATIFLDAFADGLTEGQELVTLSYLPDPCSPPQVVRLYINDNTPITFTSQGTNLTCPGGSNGQIQLNINGGSPPYTIVLNNVDTFYTPTITGLPAGTYGIQVLDNYGCGAAPQVVGGQFPGNPVFLPDGGGQAYTTTIPISGFPTGSTLTNTNMLQNVCIDMEHSFMGQLEIRLYAPNGQFIVLKEHPGGAVTNLGEPVANGPVDTNNPDTLQGNCYTYCFNANPTFGTMVSEANNYTYTYTDNRGTVLTDKYLPAGSYQPFQPFSGLLGTPLNGNWSIWVRDYNPQNNGWVCTWSISLSNDANGDTITLTQPAAPTITGAVTNAACGSANGGINLTVTGTGSPFTYAWSNGATTEDLSSIPAGNYTVTVTTAAPGSCPIVRAFQVSNTTAPTVTQVITPVSCPGGSNGGVNITVTGTGPFTYLWSNGATTQDITNVAAGTYTVTVTGSGGCQRIVAHTVTQTPGMAATAATTNETCGQEDGAISLNVTAGTAPYTYAWSNGATTSAINLIHAGTYTVTITDASGCTIIRNYSILNVVGNCFIPCDLSLAPTTLTHESCGNGLGAIDLTATSSNLPITYAWSNGATTQDISGLSAGQYRVTITDANNCARIDSFSINNQTTGLALGSPTTTPEYCNNGQGAVTLSPAGGPTPYTFAWSNGATTQNIQNLHAGTYTVTVTDANGCQASTSATIINNTGTMTQTWGSVFPETCGNSTGSIDITIAPAFQFYAYLWSNGATTEDLTGLGAGTYQCTVTDGNGCQLVTPPYTVQNNSGTLSIFDIDLYDETCSNQSGAINLDISGGATPYTYTWSNGATTQDLSNIPAGTYAATVTDANGCAATTGPLLILNNPGNLQVNIINIQHALCGGSNGAINIATTGAATPATFIWSTGSTSQDLLNRPAGAYTVTVTDANGCVATQSALIQNQPGALQITNGVVTPASCGNSAGGVNISISGNAGTTTYAWSSGATTQDLVNIPAGTYTVTVSDAAGCPATATYTVPNQSGTLSLAGAQVANAVCGNQNGGIDLTPSGGQAPLSYAWSNGATVQDLSNLLPGTYTCTITDASNCAITAGPYTVANSSGSLSVTSAVIVQPLCASNNGSIDLSVAGQAPFTYAWAGGATTQDRSNLAPGTYTVTITDGNGCQTTWSTTLASNPGTLTASVASITDATCGGAQGGVTLNVAGGTTYTYLWSNGATTAALTGVPAGTYAVTVTSGGCTRVLTGIQVANQPGTLNVTSVLKTDAICGAANGTIDLSIAGGTAPITYLWSNGATTQDLSSLAPGVYTVTISAAGGCSTTAQAVIQNTPGTLSLISATPTAATCGAANGAIALSTAGGTAPIAYQWSVAGQTTATLSNVPAGSYTCLVTDAAGCSFTYSGTVGNGGGPVQAQVASVVPVQCSGNTGAIDISPSGGTAPYTYAWSNGATTQDLSAIGTGTYTVTLTDANNCTATASATVTLAGGTLVAGQPSITHATCGNANGAITINPSGGAPPYTFNWSNGATTQNISALLPGTYSLTLSATGGCTITTSYTVNNNTGTFALSGAVVTDETCGNNTGGVNISITGGTAPLSYLWSNGATTQDITNVHAGTYGVTITDAQGCDIFAGPYTVANITGTLNVSNAITPELCGNGQGAIDLSVIGGTGPYTYTWSNGPTTQDIGSLSAGTYTVTVTDAASCASIQTFSVPLSQGTLAINAAILTPSNCGQPTGAIDISVGGGTAPYTYAWSNGPTTQDLSTLAAGNYTVTVTDAIGCEQVATYTLVSSNAMAIANTFFFDESCGQMDGFIQVDVTGGDSNYTWYLNGALPQNFGYYFGLSAGTYTVLVQDGSGCSVTTTITLVNNGNVTTGPNTVTNASCGACPDGAIDVTVNPPGTYNYFWSHGPTTQDVNSLLPGFYSVSIDDGLTCFLYLEFIVDVGTGTDPGEQQALQVWPNPSTGLFRLKHSLPEAAPVTATLHDMLGKTVWQQALGHTQELDLDIDLRHLPDGQYILRLESGETRLRARLLLQH